MLCSCLAAAAVRSTSHLRAIRRVSWVLASGADVSGPRAAVPSWACALRRAESPGPARGRPQGRKPSTALPLSVLLPHPAAARRGLASEDGRCSISRTLGARLLVPGGTVSARTTAQPRSRVFVSGRLERTARPVTTGSLGTLSQRVLRRDSGTRSFWCDRDGEPASRARTSASVRHLGSIQYFSSRGDAVGASRTRPLWRLPRRRQVSLRLRAAFGRPPDGSPGDGPKARFDLNVENRSTRTWLEVVGVVNEERGAWPCSPRRVGSAGRRRRAPRSLFSRCRSRFRPCRSSSRPDPGETDVLSDATDRIFSRDLRRSPVKGGIAGPPPACRRPGGLHVATNPPRVADIVFATHCRVRQLQRRAQTDRRHRRHALGPILLRSPSALSAGPPPARRLRRRRSPRSPQKTAISITARARPEARTGNASASVSSRPETSRACQPPVGRPGRCWRRPGSRPW